VGADGSGDCSVLDTSVAELLLGSLECGLFDGLFLDQSENVHGDVVSAQVPVLWPGSSCNPLGSDAYTIYYPISVVNVTETVSVLH